MSTAPSDTGARGGNPAMRRALVAVALVLAALSYVYRDTVGSMITIWRTSETYAHGWIIVPIALWLAWRQRECLLAMTPRFNPAGLLSMAAIALLWVVADIISVQVVQHLTLVLMVSATVLTLLGWQATRQLAFPLAFLLFAVPVGEILIPTLMEVTAVFTVNAVRLVGIPVFRDGMFFALPRGDFEVAVACSGIRYLIASVALGTLYAYLSFRSTYKRLAFMALAAIVPIIANGLRAFLIVMLAHLSNMRLAVGVDHFLYGWVFFGIVMFLLFLLGARFQEETPLVCVPDTNNRRPATVGVLGAAAAVLLAIAVSVPTAAGALRDTGSERPVTTGLPLGQGQWRGPLPGTLAYAPAYQGASARYHARYAGSAGDVHVYIEYFSAAETEAELINTRNRLQTPQWVREDVPSRTEVDEGRIRVLESPLRHRTDRLVLWHWYEVNGAPFTSDVAVKLRKLRDTLAGRFSGSALVAIGTLEGTTMPATRALLEDFMIEHYDLLRRCFYEGPAVGSPCAAVLPQDAGG